MTIKEIIQNLRVTMTDARVQDSHFESWLIQNEGICDAIDALKELDEKALAQPAQEPNNFCPRCGKRVQGVLGQPQMHTCTPPLWGHI